MANTFTQQAEDSGILQEGNFGRGINRERVVNFLNQVDEIYAQEIEKRDKEIVERDDENAKANGVIQDLQAQSKEKDTQIANLQASAKKQDDQIASLQEKVVAYEEGQKVTEGITSSLNEASKTIQSLRDENKALHERLINVEKTNPEAEAVSQRKTIVVLRNALAKAEESSDEALKSKITELEKVVQAQKEAAEGGSLWSSLGDAADAVETLSKERAEARDRQSLTRAKAIVSQAQFTALEVISKASKQYDSMMAAGESQVDVTNDTLHNGYTEYTEYIIGLNKVVEDTIQNLEDTLDVAVNKLAEAVSVVKSLREAQKPLTKAAEDVFKPVALTGIKTADKLPGVSDVLAFVAAAPGMGISDKYLSETEKDVEDSISKVDDKYSEMQANIANAQIEEEKGESEGEEEAEEKGEEPVIEEPEEVSVEETAEEAEKEGEESQESDEESEDSGETEESEEDIPDESDGIPQTDEEDGVSDETTVMPIIVKKQN